ncbi:hypothetical protein F5Y02DRAFT_232098 [Annulohypoxylon stygium]|nr:hypothetical protein F5Y02DRAFT_232098 [Annulohypoxylon stygium]
MLALGVCGNALAKAWRDLQLPYKLIRRPRVFTVYKYDLSLFFAFLLFVRVAMRATHSTRTVLPDPTHGFRRVRGGSGRYGPTSLCIRAVAGRASTSFLFSWFTRERERRRRREICKRMQNANANAKGTGNMEARDQMTKRNMSTMPSAQLSHDSGRQNFCNVCYALRTESCR